MRFAIVCSVHVVVSLAILGVARADDPNPPTPPSAKPDTTYGRIEGYAGLVLGAGATFGPRSPRATLDLRVRYLQIAGLFLTYEDGAPFGSGAEPTRVLAGGLEIRPLFLGRWLTGHESGNARADLLIDSFGLELGGFLAQPRGATFGDHPGLQVGLGLEVPIIPRASGPWIGLHGGVRWSDVALGGDASSSPDDRALYLSVTVAWHQIIPAHDVDMSASAP